MYLNYNLKKGELYPELGGIYVGNDIDYSYGEWEWFVYPEPLAPGATPEYGHTSFSPSFGMNGNSTNGVRYRMSGNQGDPGLYDENGYPLDGWNCMNHLNNLGRLNDDNYPAVMACKNLTWSFTAPDGSFSETYTDYFLPSYYEQEVLTTYSQNGGCLKESVFPRGWYWTATATGTTQKVYYRGIESRGYPKGGSTRVPLYNETRSLSKFSSHNFIAMRRRRPLKGDLG